MSDRSDDPAAASEKSLLLASQHGKQGKAYGGGESGGSGRTSKENSMSGRPRPRIEINVDLDKD